MIGQLLYRCHEYSQDKVTAAKKNSQILNHFKATLAKLTVLSCIYLYIGLSIFFTFDNAKYIPETSYIAASFIVGLILDVIIIDTAIGMICSFFMKSSDNRI